MPVASRCEHAHAAYDVGAWSTAAVAYADADASEELAAADLERWGLAAFLVGRDEESDTAREGPLRVPGGRRP